ncbi:hypothetical protein SASC598J21_002940 [Snodgrassella alvi SCGC AB-598-J21]|uniref:Uncharacterized protein n=1 Tax=Snodgrassella alvi SCGC AB-598-J21 TaxID=1385367 RepID=A0A074VDR6_9NEIS|nr:hypothetical protein SASC598J21_002940 [Snodgrassella alvi SCGC AB-598-J21]
MSATLKICSEIIFYFKVNDFFRTNLARYELVRNSLNAINILFTLAEDLQRIPIQTITFNFQNVWLINIRSLINRIFDNGLINNLIVNRKISQYSIGCTDTDN